MTLNVSVTDDQLGQYTRRCAAIADRLGKSLPFDWVMAELQRIHDGLNVQPPVKKNVISIIRNRFDPAKFIGKDWTIVSDETDARSTALTELDLAKVQHVTMLKDGEVWIRGEERIRRLKSSDYIRLDADIFLTLWENQRLIPESWKENVSGKARYIFFDGTILRSPDGDRSALFLCWDGLLWDWGCRLSLGWNAGRLSAVLAD